MSMRMQSMVVSAHSCAKNYSFTLSVRDQLFFLYTECILRVGNDEGPGTQEM